MKVVMLEKQIPMAEEAAKRGEIKAKKTEKSENCFNIIYDAIAAEETPIGKPAAAIAEKHVVTPGYISSCHCGSRHRQSTSSNISPDIMENIPLECTCWTSGYYRVTREFQLFFGFFDFFRMEV